jgi:PAS domain S-box-containing protein
MDEAAAPLNKIVKQKINATAQQLSMLLESLPMVAYICNADENFEINYVSRSIEEMTGYSPSQFMEDPVFWLKCIHEDDRKKFLDEFGASCSHEKYQTEYRIRIADNSYRWVSDSRRRVKGVDGNTEHIVGAWQDISEEIKLRQESDYRLQQIIQADKLAALGEVVAGVAHEINNPNSFITYNIPILEETWHIFEPILKEYDNRHPDWRNGNMTLSELCMDMGEIIKAIKIGSDRITRVVDNLKEFARADMGDAFKPVNINEVVEKTMLIVGGQLRKSAGDIHIDLADELPLINGHFQKLEQVVANVLVNAAQAIPDREKGKIVISTRYLKHPDCVLIEVEDNGMGMKTDVLDRIFEPFFTNRRNSGGTGLGLSVSYGLIQEHKGKICVHSKLGIGSRFMIFLPVENILKTELRPAILCVDDDLLMLDMLRTLFVEVKDMIFESTSNPENVLSYLEEHPEVDIVISDIVMPGINGWDLLAKIKHRFPLMSVILYSGNREVLMCRPEGVPAPDQLLEKPFEIKKLLNIIYTTDRQRV